MSARRAFVICALLVVSIAVFAQTYYELADANKDSRIAITNIYGNGSSSGAALSGYLANTTSSTIRVAVYMASPVLFANSGAGQNMAATEVYLSDGSYTSDGSSSFIEIAPKSKLKVIFIAYCTDFEKDNPAQTDSFRLVGAPPAILLDVLSRIGTYAKNHPNTDITAAAQLAIWMTQGVTLEHISDKFDFADQDAAIAKSLMK